MTEGSLACAGVREVTLGDCQAVANQDNRLSKDLGRVAYGQKS